jgi:hypothetical protein
MRQESVTYEEQLTGARAAKEIAGRELAEAGATAYVASRFAGPPVPRLLWPASPSDQRPAGGMGLVFHVAERYDRRYVVIESMLHDSEHRERAVAGGRVNQGTRRYLESVIDEAAHGHDAEGRRVGRVLLDALREDNVFYLEVRTDPTPGGQIVGRLYNLDVDTGIRT